MKKSLACLSLAFLLTACGSLPKAASSPSQHDLGGSFHALKHAGLPVQRLTVSAAPVVASHVMAYREAVRPTLRGAYAFNRWAAPPANLVEQALGRILPMKAGSHCRLDFQLADAILEIDRENQASVLLSGSLRLIGAEGGLLARELVEQRSPVAKPGPAEEAEGLRLAVEALAGQTAAWLDGEAGKACR